MRIILLLLIASFSTSMASAQFGKLKSKIEKAAKDVVNPDKENGSSQIGLGLKEALEVGTTEAVKSLSKEKGYLDSPYKILLPEEAQKVVKRVSGLPGFSDVEKKLVDKMNQAAEIAAKEATPIFVDAIKGITFTDALNILKGKDDAATRYLEKSARKDLYKKFLPVIQSSLDEVDARTYWKSVVKQYNKIPFIKKMNPDLDDHVNNKALDGMFGLIEKKEEGIRTDIDQRTSPLLLDVFSQLD